MSDSSSTGDGDYSVAMEERGDTHCKRLHPHFIIVCHTIDNNIILSMIIQ